MTLATAKRVLVIDDSPFILEATKAALTDVGFEVAVAQDLREAEAHCKREHDLILIDVQMPEAFGDDLAMLLKVGRQMKTPIFLLSSLPDDELGRRAEEAEVDGYISKRVGMEAIVKRVQEILGVAESAN
jgi:two-component system sensor histidine kinase and response regulator WspE